MTTLSPMRLGVCYYPEDWPETLWAEDAARMVAMGISHVRIAEFAWSRIEPKRGQFDWGWLDRAVEVPSGHSINNSGYRRNDKALLLRLRPAIAPFAPHGDRREGDDAIIRKFGEGRGGRRGGGRSAE